MDDTTSESKMHLSLHRAEDIRSLLLNTKELPALSAKDLDDLRQISKLDVSSYSEADVRAEVIDPIVRILGYRKEHYFSLEREKNLKFLGKDRYIDYKMTLWSESFWVIEAKKVKRQVLRFTWDELEQVLCYAAHPEINAALMVLCDGRLLEIYDREESLAKPVERVEVRNLVEDFPKLQRLLSPWQAWFFQKRRIPRLVDKVMDHEINLGRLDEIRGELNRTLDKKRAIVMDNRRKLLSTVDQSEARQRHIGELGLSDLVNDLMFSVRTQPDCNAVVNAVIARGGLSGFHSIFAIFPDQPRDMNDTFVAMSLRVLIAYEESSIRVDWLPSWLTGPGYPADIESAIKKLIALALDSFSADPARKAILQYSACARRMAKLMTAMIPTATQLGALRHQNLRYWLDELDDAQMASTPEGHTLSALGTLQTFMTSTFVRECTNSHQKFDVSRALTELKDAWASERMLLHDGTEYWASLAGRGLTGELEPTEYNWVTYDNLAHRVLCALSHSAKWTNHVEAQHREDLMRIASMGSWKARELLEKDVVLDPISEQHLADRFFAGSVDTYLALSNAYSKRALPTR
ncbi:type I restriction enzyme HsdR N-terminal domain-containing protein [Lysobacter capsici]|uniref:type I restriction enzyme HsdR N-terminal domain-containing protein n=1 Tax=Lysobacter capsici TaxID=435897 RepID=UPI000BBB17E4|nr:type I restriction enzyme HsdR N-terminal domain-containing protein [Lysobacter capsici]ATE70763.1 type I restriction endonuclease subunit R [Lysobacter capsici]